MATNDGGPAFPVSADRMADGVLLEDRVTGMTLRDYLAAAALTGLIAHGRSYDFRSKDEKYGFAESSYAIADAMLETREVGK